MGRPDYEDSIAGDNGVKDTNSGSAGWLQHSQDPTDSDKGDS